MSDRQTTVGDPLPLKEAARRIDAAFIQGAACALAEVIRTFDEPTIATEVLRGMGFGLDDLRKAKVPPYDLAPLRKALRDAQ